MPRAASLSARRRARPAWRSRLTGKAPPPGNPASTAAPPQAPPPGSWVRSLRAWIPVVLLVAANYFLSSTVVPDRPQRTEVPYTVFKQQLAPM